MKYDKSLEQVWEWKDAIYNEVKGFPVKEQIAYISREAKKASSLVGGRAWKAVRKATLSH